MKMHKTPTATRQDPDEKVRRNLKPPFGYVLLSDGLLGPTDLVFDNFTKKFRTQDELRADHKSGKYGQEPLPSEHRSFYTAVAVHSPALVLKEGETLIIKRGDEDDLAQVVMQLNCELFDKLGEKCEHVFSYTTTGFHDSISVDGIVLWDSEGCGTQEIERVYAPHTGKRESMISFIRRAFNVEMRKRSKLFLKQPKGEK